MSTDEEEMLVKVRSKKKQIVHSDDSDSEPVTQRRCRSGRVYVSDSEVNPTIKRDNLYGVSDDDSHTRPQVWSEGDEQSEESGDSSEEESDTQELDFGSEEVNDSGDEHDTSKADPSSVSSDSDSEVDGSDENCPVCLSKFKSQEIGTPESCDHTFCLECILEWSKKVTTCPIDRQQYSLILVRKSSTSKIIRRIPIKTIETLGLPAAAETDLHVLTVCEVCELGDREDRLLLCDGCDRGYHCDCLSPVLDEVPIEEWFCPDCASQFNEEVSEIEAGSGRSNRRLATSMEPVIRRVIARTRASESVIQRVNRNRSQRSLNSRSSNSRASPTKKTRKCKTVKRRARKRSKKTSSNKTGKKSKSTRLTHRKRKYRRKRKVSSKKRCSKTTNKASRYVKVPSIRKRIADKLGIQKSKGPSHALPKIKKPSIREQLSNCSLSIFGNSTDATNYEEFERIELEGSYDGEISASDGGMLALAGSRTTLARRMVRKGLLNIDSPSTSGVSSLRRNAPCPSASREFVGTSSGPVDILGGILKDQSILHGSSQDILVKPDGSLSKMSNEAEMKLPTSLQYTVKQNTAANFETTRSSTVSSSQPESGSAVTVQNNVSSSNSNQATSACSDSKPSTSRSISVDQSVSDVFPDSTVSIPKAFAKKKKKTKKKEEEDISLYSDIDDDAMEEGEVLEYQSAFQVPPQQEQIYNCSDVTPSYSPIVDVSDEDLVIDESKNIAARAENVADLQVSPKLSKASIKSFDIAEPRAEVVTDSVNKDEKSLTHQSVNNITHNVPLGPITSTEDKQPVSVLCEDSLGLEGISETEEQVYQSDSDSVTIPVPADMDFQLCKDNVFESPDNENNNSEMRDIQDMLSPVSAAASSKESDHECSEDEQLVIREKIHPNKSTLVKSTQEDDNSVNWKKLSRSTKIRSYRDGKPKDKQTYFQDREIKRKRRNLDTNPTYVPPKKQQHNASSSTGTVRERSEKRLDDIENRKRRSRRERSRYSRDRNIRSRSPDGEIRRFSKLRMDQVIQEMQNSDSRKRRHRHRHRHHVEKAFHDSSNKSKDKEKLKRKRRHSHSDEEKVQRRKRLNRVSHSPKRSKPESTTRKSRRAALDKEVIASGDNITVKLNFDKNQCVERDEEVIGNKVDTLEDSDAKSVDTPVQLIDEEDIIILSSPSSSSCSVYTIEDSELEITEQSPFDLGEESVDEVVETSPVQKSDGITEFRKVVIEENTDESDTGPGSLRIVLSCDSADERNAMEASAPEKRDLPIVSEIISDDKSSMIEKYDPFEPTLSPSPEQTEIITKAPPLPELPPLPPEPPVESLVKPALPDFQENPDEHTVIDQVPPCLPNWSIPGPLPPAPMPPPQILPPPIANNIVIQPINSSMFSRPPPTHMSTPIRIIPPAVLPSTPAVLPPTSVPPSILPHNALPSTSVPPPNALLSTSVPPPNSLQSASVLPPNALPSTSVPPPNALQSTSVPPPNVLPSTSVPPPPLLHDLPHQLNVPPPNISQNIPLKPPPSFSVASGSKSLCGYQKPPKENFYQVAEDATDVIDMELDTSPYSNEDNTLAKSARHVGQRAKAGSKAKIPPLKITNDLKIDSFLLSLVTNKQILHTLAKKGPSNETSKQKTRARSANKFPDQFKSSNTSKRKHTTSKSPPRKTGPRTPESDSNEPQFDDLFDEIVRKPTMTDRKKHKSAKKPSSSYMLSSSSLPVHSLEEHKKGAGVKIAEDKLQVIDDFPNSAVELQVKEKFLKKLNRQERVIEEVKLALKPHYHKRDIGKEDYKEIMRKAVPKICHNKAGEINPLRIKSLVEGYVKKCKHVQKKRSALPSSTT